MKLPELLQSLNRISANGLSRHAQPEVVIPIYQPGRLGGQFAVPVTHVNLGFDWDQGKLFLESDESLTLLSAEEVEDIRKHASLGQNRESHQRYAMLTNLLARIHRDGGQYVRQHGLDKAFADADVIVAELYAAPVSEAKAQGVVMPERANASRGSHDHQSGWNACLDEVARLNAAPVQQGSVPASAFASRAITHYEAALLAAFPSGSSGEVFNQWNEARRVLAAAPAAPAADAGLIEALALCVKSLDQLLPYLGKVPADIGLLNDALMAARPALAAHSAKGVV